MKEIEIDFVLVLEKKEYAVLHHIAKSNGLTVEKYLINCYGDLVNGWELRSTAYKMKIDTKRAISTLMGGFLLVENGEGRL